MPRPRYSATFSDTGVWIFWSVISVLVFLATVMAMIHYKLDRTLGNWVIPICMSSLAIVPVLVALVRGRMRRSRVGRLGAELARAGFRIDPEPARSTRAAHYQRAEECLGQLQFFQGGAAGCTWIAWEQSGTLDKPGGALVLEHEFIVGGGRNAQTFEHTIIAWPTELVTNRLTLARRRHWMRRRHGEGISVPELAARLPGWCVWGDAETARRLAAQDQAVALLAESPKGESWQIGGGQIAVTYPRRLQPAGLSQMLAAARGVVQGLTEMR